MRVPKRRNDMGILHIAIQLMNQRDEVVQEGEHRLMIPRDPDVLARQADG